MGQALPGTGVPILSPAMFKRKRSWKASSFKRSSRKGSYKKSSSKYGYRRKTGKYAGRYYRRVQRGGKWFRRYAKRKPKSQKIMENKKAHSPGASITLDRERVVTTQTLTGSFNWAASTSSRTMMGSVIRLDHLFQSASSPATYTMFNDNLFTNPGIVHSGGAYTTLRGMESVNAPTGSRYRYVYGYVSSVTATISMVRQENDDGHDLSSSWLMGMPINPAQRGGLIPDVGYPNYVLPGGASSTTGGMAVSFDLPGLKRKRMTTVTGGSKGGFASLKFHVPLKKYTLPGWPYNMTDNGGTGTWLSNNTNQLIQTVHGPNTLNYPSLWVGLFNNTWDSGASMVVDFKIHLKVYITMFLPQLATPYFSIVKTHEDSSSSSSKDDTKESKDEKKEDTDDEDAIMERDFKEIVTMSSPTRRKIFTHTASTGSTLVRTESMGPKGLTDLLTKKVSQ